MTRSYMLLATLLACLGSTEAAVLGIDWGSDFIKVSVVSITGRGQPLIDIVLNPQSKRKTPNSLTFRDGIRYVGADSALLYPRFPLHTLSATNLFAGLPATSNHTASLLQKTMAIPYMLSTDERDAIRFIVPSPPPRTDTATPTDAPSATISVSVEASLAMLLERFRREATAHCGKSVTHAVFAMRADASPSARAALENAAGMVGLSVLAFVPTGLAAGVAFSISQGDRLHPSLAAAGAASTTPASPAPVRVVTVFDIGVGATEATVLAFIPPSQPKGKSSKNKPRTGAAIRGTVRVIGHAIDDTIGGRALDVSLAAELARRYAASPGGKRFNASRYATFDPAAMWDVDASDPAHPKVTPRNADGRAWARLLAAGREVKERLSANHLVRAVVPAEVTGTGEDYVFDMRRVDFEPMARKPMQAAVAVLNAAVRQARRQLIRLMASRLTSKKGAEPAPHIVEAAVDAALNVSTVELFGGATRVPLLQEMISSTYGYRLRHSLNTDEAAAMGCAYIGAQLSNGMRVVAPAADVTLPRVVHMQLSPSPDVPSHKTAPPSVRVLFAANTTTPMRRLITIKRSADFNLSLTESNVAPMGRVTSTNNPLADYFFENVTTARAAAAARANLTAASAIAAACDVVLAFRLNASATVVLSSAEVRCMSAAATANATGKGSPAKKSKPFTAPLMVRVVHHVRPLPMDAAAKAATVAQLDAFRANDAIRTAVAAARNALEGAIINCRGAGPSESVEAHLANVSEWLEYGDGSSHGVAAPYVRALREVAEVCKETMEAAEERKRREEALSEDDLAEGAALRAERREARRRLREEMESDAKAAKAAKDGSERAGGRQEKAAGAAVAPELDAAGAEADGDSGAADDAAAEQEEGGGDDAAEDSGDGPADRSEL